jgi:hypothetical protein
VRFGLAIFLCAAILAAIAGCSSSIARSNEAFDDATHDASTAADGSVSDVSDLDAATVVAVTPAFTPEVPRIVNDGGAILSKPQLVTVTWTTDPNEKALEDFGDAIGTSSYWKLVGEYGVGEATSAHVEVSDAPASTMTEDELASFVADHVAAAPANGWPVNTEQTAYVIYTPPSMQITSNGSDDCDSTDGYHDETSTSSIAHIVYAVVMEACHDSQDVVSFSTETASHEMIESATDPHWESDLAWSGFDSDHLAWDVWQEQQDEIADACEYNTDADYEEVAPFAYGVQRFWSNASAAAGHNPCVRAPTLPYFNTTPLDTEAINVTVSSEKTASSTKGFEIPVGSSKVIRFGFYADGKGGPWTFQVVEGDGFTTPSAPHLKIASDRASGDNGDIANVTVDVDSVGTKTGILMTAISTRGSEPIHYMPVLIGAY